MGFVQVQIEVYGFANGMCQKIQYRVCQGSREKTVFLRKILLGTFVRSNGCSQN